MENEFSLFGSGSLTTKPPTCASISMVTKECDYKRKSTRPNEIPQGPEMWRTRKLESILTGTALYIQVPTCVGVKETPFGT
jgi:hypothetical protein